MNADTFVEGSAWVITQGITEVYQPAVPKCWQGQQLGDSLHWLDLRTNAHHSTRYRADLQLRTAWGVINEVMVFGVRFPDHVICNPWVG